MDSLDNTFSLFFGGDDEPEPKACTDCGTENDLVVLFTKENGNTVWICKSCKAKRDAARKAHEEQEAARIAAMVARDEWEEG